VRERVVMERIVQIKNDGVENEESIGRSMHPRPFLTTSPASLRPPASPGTKVAYLAACACSTESMRHFMEYEGLIEF